MFEIRPARSTDAELIFDLICELAKYERLADEVVGSAEDIRRSLLGDRPAAEVVIGQWDGEPVAFALFFSTYSTFLARPGIWLEDLFVRPEFRGRGIGRALLEHLADFAERRGCGRLEWAVLDWNEPAIEFYRRLGARPQDQWTTWRITGTALRELASAPQVDDRK
jgi:GNAT superfamily N-acetyltransferase